MVQKKYFKKGTIKNKLFYQSCEIWLHKKIIKQSCIITWIFFRKVKAAKKRSLQHIISQKQQFRLNPAYLVDEPLDENEAPAAHVAAAVTFDMESVQKRVVEGDDASDDKAADRLTKEQEQSPKLRIE